MQKPEALSKYLLNELTKNIEKFGFFIDGAIDLENITAFEKEVLPFPPLPLVSVPVCC